MGRIRPEVGHCRPGPKAKVAWPACWRCRHGARDREWRDGAAMGGVRAAPAALSWRHEHEGSQEKAPGKVMAAGSHRASKATTGRQSRAVG
jgi:hypothetical protein